MLSVVVDVVTTGNGLAMRLAMMLARCSALRLRAAADRRPIFDALSTVINCFGTAQFTYKCGLRQVGDKINDTFYVEAGFDLKQGTAQLHSLSLVVV